MKKISIIFAAVAMMAMTACNEKPAKQNEGADQTPATTTEQVDTASLPKVDVEHAKPTADGKDHVVAEFNTKEYQLRLENLADGTYRLSLWNAGKDKSGVPAQKIETKDCVLSDGNYLMKADDGKMYIINTQNGTGQFTIMTDKEFIYNGEALK